MLKFKITKTGVRIAQFLVCWCVLFLIFDFVNSKFVQPSCDDCFAKTGWPFVYFNHGGFVGGGGYIPSGVLANLALLAPLAAAITWLVEKFASRDFSTSEFQFIEKK